MRLVEEPLKLNCFWNDCGVLFTDYREFIQHVNMHAEEAALTDNSMYNCMWQECHHVSKDIKTLIQHVCYHGYHTKLKNIGSNVLERIKLPKCTQISHFVIPESVGEYICEWGDCYRQFSTYFDFLEHIKVHINSNPKYCKKGEIIECCWRGCISKFASQYKLSDHLRSHTKERVIACPTCGNMFATKTKFCDHRRRQLPIERELAAVT